MARPERRAPNHGFLGSTSFAAVYAEDQGLGKLESPASGPIDSNGPPAPDLGNHVRLGASCLALLYGMPTYEPLLQLWKAQNPLSMISPWIEACESSLSDVYAQILSPPEDKAAHILSDCSTRLYENSLRSLVLSEDCTFDQFADMITGTRLRWESVGMYFTAVGLAAMTVDVFYLPALGGAERGGLNSRRALARKMLEASDTCKLCCELAGQLTDPESWLYCENQHLCTLINGDASYLSWRRLGDLVSICLAQGLHGEIKPSATVPFWLSETRKRQFAVTYNIDKTGSSFLGRPPRLQRKYCSMQLPLDLEPRHLRLPASELEAEINKLDDAGWNTEGSFRVTVYVRATLICNMIIEDIQELMLSTLPENISALAQNILSRSHEAWESLPNFIRNAPRNPTSGVAQAYLPAAIKITFLHNEFLLNRVLVKTMTTSNDELVRISRTELSMVLEMLQQHNKGRHAIDMSWFIVKFALPAAGILALELLQGHHASRSFQRSEVIQNLSSLIAALKWVISKQDANQDICSYAFPVLQKILDVVLNPRPDVADVSSADIDIETEPDIASRDDLLYQTWSEAQFWSLLPQHPLLVDH